MSVTEETRRESYQAVLSTLTGRQKAVLRMRRYDPQVVNKTLCGKTGRRMSVWAAITGGEDE
ncbi:MAG: hypothetical protein FWG82_06160 [Oscillospiraceae bacterium]|nr:hypothetical protein [Oscillospiraceae bacterium]